MKKLWKTLLPDMKSENGEHKWEIGEWYKVNSPIKLCRNGFHASENIINAMKYVSPGYICEVEVRGDHKIGEDKQVWSEMRVISAYGWTKYDSVKLAIYVAELALPIYEKEKPDDNKPRKAIEAARAWLKNPSNKAATTAVSAADAVYDSADVNDSAVDVYCAAHAARYAARTAAHAARDINTAVNGVGVVSDIDIDGVDIKTKCHDYIVELIKQNKAERR